MKKNATKFTLGIIALIIVASFAYWANMSVNQHASPDTPTSMEEALAQLHEEGEEAKAEEAEHRVEAKIERYEYFFRLVRDPATNSIPKNIRARELNHARRLPTIDQVNRQLKSKNASIAVAEGFNWQLAGPPAVGGRTRALGIDQRNANIVIAGGVSGGIWKSTNGGDSWTLRTPDAENFSVTSLAQDPTNPDVWYYTAGEYLGNSASVPGASYYGSGVFRSTDNGSTWSRIPGTADDDTRFDSQFDFVSRIIVSPVTGTVFIASNGLGVFRSPNGTDYNDLTLGAFGEYAFSEISVAPNGTLVGVLSTSTANNNDTSSNPGVYISTDDGQSWANITPSTFPAQHARSVATFAPSNPNIIYVFTQKVGDDTNQGVSFHKIDISGGLPGTSEDRSANLPDFGGSVGGLNLQGGYNMTVAVKPDDPNLVTLGGTNLYRSFDGFATAPSGNTSDQRDEFWIGGYAKANNVSQYANNHPDQHVQVYDPTDPNRMWAGHDGGLSVTSAITATDVTWTDRNSSYIVTQFYDASIPETDPDNPNDQRDNRLMGGAQDNGTPFFRYNGSQTNLTLSSDISSGDGAFSAFSDSYIFVETQNGNIRRWNTDGNGNITNPFAFVHPAQASGQLFINPYAVDPNDETIMYYPAGNSLFRNTQIDQITNQSIQGATTGWEQVNAAQLPTGYSITALKASTVPANVLYYAGSSSSQAPAIMRLDNANTSNSSPADISIPEAQNGANVSSIAVNPANSNDALVVMSNYNIIGLYHTSDGGNNWEAVEGNLTGVNDDTSPNPGPSLRAATIVPSSSGAIYILATSTGVYATQNLDGSNTTWGREAINQIGFSVVEDVTSRISNGDVAVGSHGRGMFLGQFQGAVDIPDNPTIAVNPTEGRAGEEVTITATNFQFSTTASENEVFFGDVPAEVTDATGSQLTVIVPRNTLPPNPEDRIVLITVNNNGADPQPVSFTILPPNQNALNQNFPNPFGISGGTKIPISLQNSSNVTITIYDISGRRVDQPLKDDTYQSGTYDIPVNFNGMASGIYIYQIIAKPTGSTGDTFVDSEKFTFIK